MPAITTYLRQDMQDKSNFKDAWAALGKLAEQAR
jgi:hypothetical protein